MCEAKKIVEELRNKKSRDNRELLDRSADMIEKLAKELCDKSGCHHKCKNTKDCVVEDEAKELFKQALVEGVGRHFDKIIEQEKQIEEMANILKDYTKKNHIMASSVILEDYAEALYNAEYRKQSEGEWNDNIIGFCNVCMNCGAIVERSAIKNNSGKLNFCPNCGAKMKGGE